MAGLQALARCPAASPRVTRVAGKRCGVLRRQATCTQHTARFCFAPASGQTARRLLRKPLVASRCTAATAASAADEASTTPAALWRNAWYAVSFVADLDVKEPIPFTLLGEPIVLWHGDGEWHAFVDRCPHRLAPLSEGRINEDNLLECAYHGWAFSSSGACQTVPQDRLDKAHSSPRACVTSYATAVAQGVLFVRPSTATDAPPLPLLPELEEPGWVVTDIARELPYDYATLLENVLDVSHVPWVHHKTVSNRANSAPLDLEVVSPITPSGFRGYWAEGPRRGQLGPQSTQFVAPGLMRHELSAKSLGTTLTVVYATPTKPGSVLLLARFPFKFKSWLPRLVISLAPRWMSHLSQMAILEDDNVLLHKQERELESAAAQGKTYAQACYLPTAADAYIVAFRDWLVRYGGGGPAWPAGSATALPPVSETREAVLERYNAHTRKCASCSRALRVIRAVRAAAAVVGAVAALIAAGSMTAAAYMSRDAAVRASPNLAAVAVAVGCVILWLRLGKTITAFFVGPYPPPRNLPDKKKLISRGPKNSGKRIKLV